MFGTLNDTGRLVSLMLAPELTLAQKEEGKTNEVPLEFDGCSQYVLPWKHVSPGWIAKLTASVQSLPDLVKRLNELHTLRIAMKDQKHLAKEQKQKPDVAEAQWRGWNFKSLFLGAAPKTGSFKSLFGGPLSGTGAASNSAPEIEPLERSPSGLTRQNSGLGARTSALGFGRLPARLIPRQKGPLIDEAGLSRLEKQLILLTDEMRSNHVLAALPYDDILNEISMTVEQAKSAARTFKVSDNGRSRPEKQIVDALKEKLEVPLHAS